MQEEGQTILRMLAEGKITAEEAGALLDALEAGPPDNGKSSGRRPPAPAGMTEGFAGFAGRVASWGAEVGARVAEEIREGRVPVLNWLSDCFDGRETLTEREGRFAEEEIEVDCSCEAGSFVLRGMEEPGYRLSVRQRFGHEDGPSIADEGGRLTVKGSGIIRGDILLEKSKRYRVRLRSSAGRLEIDGLTLSTGSVDTDAGSIRLGGLVADGLNVRSAAGSVEGTGLSIRDLRATTNCGRIHLELAPVESGRCAMETDVGAISLNVPLGSDLGYLVRAEADIGSISCSPDFTIREDDRSIGHRRLRAESAGYDERPHRVEIEARTDCGSIRINGVTVH